MSTPLHEPEIVTRKGKPISVILPLKVYEELLERLEDAEDVAWLKCARKTPLHYRPLEDYLEERKLPTKFVSCASTVFAIAARCIADLNPASAMSEPA